MTEEPKDYEPGWEGLSKLFFWWRWKWVHHALGHVIEEGLRRSDDEIVSLCNCGMTWDK